MHPHMHSALFLWQWPAMANWAPGTLNYTRAKNPVNQARNFNATLGPHDHQSFIPISHKLNQAQMSAVLSKISSLMAS